MSDANWRDKDDLELTSEDISAIAAEGQPVAARGPRLPGNATVVEVIANYGAAEMYRL